MMVIYNINICIVHLYKDANYYLIDNNHKIDIIKTFINIIKKII